MIGVTPGPRAQLVSAGTGVIAAIPTGTLVIGRAPDSDVVIPTRDVSRRHAVIRRAPEGYVIRDLSTNGTFVNGQRVNGPLLLSMGDIISIGGEQLRFEVDAGLPLDPGGEVSSGPESAHSRMVEPPTRPHRAVFQ
jgi:pSer/pThr/pTyr-binding forkhead associated (FHA) protein